MRSVAVCHPSWAKDHGAHGPGHSHRTYETVVRAVTAVSPLVEVTAPGCTVFAAKGPSRYFGGDRAVAGAVWSAVEACGRGRFGIGVAGSRFAAQAAARFSAGQGHPCVVAEEETPSFIAALPVAALHRIAGVPVEVVDLFVRLGLGTCGALVAVGERALTERFGAAGREVHRLVTATETGVFDPEAPPPDIVRAVDLDVPLAEVHRVVSAARPCIDGALDAVARTGRQCVRALVACETDHAETSERIWVEPHGFSPAALAQRLAWQIEGWLVPPDAESPEDPGVSAGVVRVVITPLECREVLVDQPVLWGGHRENAERAARAAGLAAATDASVAVTVPRWAGGRDASGGYVRIPVDLVDLGDERAARARVGQAADGPSAPAWRGSLPVPSPAVVHADPVPVRVLDAAGVDVVVTGRHEFSSPPACVAVGRLRYGVECHAGPWPVEERWWDLARRRRIARVQVLVVDPRSGDERVLLLGREGGEWHLLACYD